MKPAPAEIAFLGHVFLKPDAAELAALGQELQLPDWERTVVRDAARLTLEHNRLFLNPLGSPCMLWQSANTEEARLMGEAHLSALEWFGQYGVEPTATNDPADHVGLLLLLYAHLLETDASTETIERFRAAHLEWIRGFCDKVQAASTLAFYQTVAERLREMV
jgi:TorA maturation chaperone TorD